MKFPIKDFLNKCDQIRSFLAYLVTFTQEILNENFIFYAVWMLLFGWFNWPILSQNSHLF